MSNAEPKELPQTGYIRLATLIAFLEVSKSTVWRWARDQKNSFPAPIKLGENVTAWDAAKIHEWIESKATSQEVA